MDRIPLTKTLLCHSSPHQQFQAKPPSSVLSYPIYTTPTYAEWVDFVGLQILYLHGSSYRPTQDVAEQILFAWEAKYRTADIWSNSVISFAFESTDPRGNAIPNMVASVLVQVLAGQQTETTKEVYDILRDSFRFRK